MCFKKFYAPLSLQRDRLELKLRTILAGRIRVALANATGYALDDLGDNGSEEDDIAVQSKLSVHVPSLPLSLER